MFRGKRNLIIVRKLREENQNAYHHSGTPCSAGTVGVRLNGSQYNDPCLFRMPLQMLYESFVSDANAISHVRRMHVVKRTIIGPNCDAGVAEIQPFLCCRDSNDVAGVNFRL